MGTISALLLKFGFGGMFIAAFLAGSVFPFSSELVMIGLLLAGSSPWLLLLWATAGNTLGSMLNYGIGRIGKPEWIEKYAHVKPENMVKAEKFVQTYGSWMGLLAWIPILGSAIAIALGLLRSNPMLTLLMFAIGKIVRYIIVIEAITNL